jgi:hypothetical protein
VSHEASKVVVYIKPWDDKVFENFIDLVLFVASWEEENEIFVDLRIPPDLHK